MNTKERKREKERKKKRERVEIETYVYSRGRFDQHMHAAFFAQTTREAFTGQRGLANGTHI